MSQPAQPTFSDDQLLFQALSFSAVVMRDGHGAGSSVIGDDASKKQAGRANQIAELMEMFTTTMGPELGLVDRQITLSQNQLFLALSFTAVMMSDHLPKTERAERALQLAQLMAAFCQPIPAASAENYSGKWV